MRQIPVTSGVLRGREGELEFHIPKPALGTAAGGSVLGCVPDSLRFLARDALTRWEGL